MFLLVLAFLWMAACLVLWWGYHADRWQGRYHLDVANVGLLLLAAVGFFWRIILGRSWMPADGGDLASFLFPMYRFSAQSIREGILPLWNPHLYGGSPYIGDIQAGLTYPVNLLTFFLARPITFRTMEWLSILHVWWAGAGMYTLLRLRVWQEREAGLHRWASLAGAVAFMFSDGFLTHFGNLNLVAVASWLPWIFWAYVRGSDTRQVRMGWAVGAGALLGIATLAGHAQITLFITLALFLYSAFSAYLDWSGQEGSQTRSSDAATTARLGHPLVRTTLYFLTCIVVAVLLAAVVLLPGLELSAHTARADWEYQQTVGYSLSPAQWIGMLVPGFFGRGPQFHWGLWPRVEVGYLGILPLVLALLAVVRGRPRRMWPLLGLAVTAFLIALGIYSLPHGWLTALVPGFGQLRAPARLVLVMDFGLAALAALGLDALLRPSEEDEPSLRRVFRVTSRAAGAICAVGLPLAYFALITAQDRSPEIYSRISVATIGVATFAALLLASAALLAAQRYAWAKPRTLGMLAAVLIFLDLASTGAYNDLGAVDPTGTFEHPEIVSFLRSDSGSFRIDARTGIDQLWQPDTALLYGLDDVGGVVNPLVLADYERYWEGMGSRSSPLYDFLNVRYVIARKDVELDWDKFEPAFDGDPSLGVYRNRGFDPATTVVIEGAVATLAPAVGEERVEILDHNANEMVIKVQASAPAYLVLSEVFYPGWRVIAEDHATLQIQRANYAFRSVAVEPGLTQLRLVYAPATFRVGVVVSGVTAFALVAGAIWVWRRPKRGEGRGPD